MLRKVFIYELVNESTFTSFRSLLGKNFQNRDVNVWLILITFVVIYLFASIKESQLSSIEQIILFENRFFKNCRSHL